MTGDEFAARLVHDGLDPVEGPAKAALYELAVQALAPTGSATHAWWVPGRLEVFGKHTDYAGGRTLVAAVPRGFVFASTPRADDAIVVIDATSGEQVCLGAESVQLSGWRRYVDVVAARLRRNFPGWLRWSHDRLCQRSASGIRHEQLQRAGGRCCDGAHRRMVPVNTRGLAPRHW